MGRSSWAFKGRIVSRTQSSIELDSRGGANRSQQLNGEAAAAKAPPGRHRPKVSRSKATEARDPASSSSSSSSTGSNSRYPGLVRCPVHPNMEALPLARAGPQPHHPPDSCLICWASNMFDEPYFMDRRSRFCLCNYSLLRRASSLDMSPLYATVLHGQPSAGRTDPEESKVTEARLTRIANLHHLPRVTLATFGSGRGGSSGSRPQQSSPIGSSDSCDSAIGSEERPKTAASSRSRRTPPGGYSSSRVVLGDDHDDDDNLSILLLEEADALYQYVAARGQREKEQEIYEVLPPTIICNLSSTQA